MHTIIAHEHLPAWSLSFGAGIMAINIRCLFVI